MSTWTIVVAAGAGTRFGAAKQFLELGGRRLVDIALDVAAAISDGVILVLPPDVVWDGRAVARVVTGGATRSESVRAGLDAVPGDATVVVVHDAARPLATRALFEAVIAAVHGGADAAVPGVAITDTVKRVDGDRVVETLARERLVAVQTPQAFRITALQDAHATGGEGTDDAALVERAGGTVVVVPGDARNIKITHPTDLSLAAAVLAAESAP